MYILLHHENVADRKSCKLEGIHKLKNKSMSTPMKHGKCTEWQFSEATV